MKTKAKAMTHMGNFKGWRVYVGDKKFEFFSLITKECAIEKAIAKAEAEVTR